MAAILSGGLLIILCWHCTGLGLGRTRCGRVCARSTLDKRCRAPGANRIRSLAQQQHGRRSGQVGSYAALSHESVSHRRTRCLGSGLSATSRATYRFVPQSSMKQDPHSVNFNPVGTMRPSRYEKWSSGRASSERKDGKGQRVVKYEQACCPPAGLHRNTYVAFNETTHQIRTQSRIHGPARA